MNSRQTFNKIIICLVVFLLFVSIPIVGVITVVYAMPDAYENEYAKVLEIQFNYLKETYNEDRIIVVGTSSTAFGLNGDTIAEQFNKKVVLFGAYGAVGNTCMLDWAKKYIHKGDIVVYMYDIYDESLSINFDPEIALHATYKNMEMFNLLSNKYKCQTIAELPKYMGNNIEKALSNEVEDGVGSFSAKAFNEKGYMTYPRIGRHPTAEAPKVKEYSKKETIDPELTSYINNWASDLRKKQVKVFFHYGPIDEDTRAYSDTDAILDDFGAEWEKQIGIETICKIKNNYFPTKLFYDSEHHFNSLGAVYFTSYFIRNLETALYGGSSYPLVKV